MVFDWNRAAIARLSLFWSFTYTEQVFAGVLSVYTLVYISVSRLLASSTLSLRHMKQKENSGNSPPHHCLSSEVPHWSAFSPSFRIFLCLFYIHPGSFAAFRGWNREKYVYSLSLKWKFLFWYFQFGFDLVCFTLCTIVYTVCPWAEEALMKTFGNNVNKLAIACLETLEPIAMSLFCIYSVHIKGWNCIHTVLKGLLNAYYILVTVLGTGHTITNRVLSLLSKSLCLVGEKEK